MLCPPRKLYFRGTLRFFWFLDPVKFFNLFFRSIVRVFWFLDHVKFFLTYSFAVQLGFSDSWTMYRFSFFFEHIFFLVIFFSLRGFFMGFLIHFLISNFLPQIKWKCDYIFRKFANFLCHVTQQPLNLTGLSIRDSS